jgi:hypothetical protein
MPELQIVAVISKWETTTPGVRVLMGRFEVLKAANN